MPKRWKYLMVIVGGVGLAVVITLFATREREPEYGGKKLSEWVELYGTNVSREDAVAVAECRHAIESIGTTAVPFLLKWLQFEPPRWKIALYNKLNRGFHLSVVPNPRNYNLAMACIPALEAFGPEVDSSVPELIRLLNEPDNAWDPNWRIDSTPYRAARVLLGFGRAGLPPLQDLLKNQKASPNLRYFMARELILSGSEGRTNAFEALLSLVASPDPSVSLRASNAVQKINPVTLRQIGVF